MKMKSLLYVQRKFWNWIVKDKKYRKVRDHCHNTEQCRTAAHSICNLKLGVPKNSSMAFQSGSNYDYQLIIKELAE